MSHDAEGMHRETPAPTPDDLLHGFADGSLRSPDTLEAPREARTADRPQSGNGFADSAPGSDAAGRPVPCTVCGAGLSQPRIDYGRRTCPRCRPDRKPLPAAASMGSRGGRS